MKVESMKRNRIAILGAGTGGLVVANELARLAPQQDHYVD